jgi:hypothetical protein
MFPAWSRWAYLLALIAAVGCKTAPRSTASTKTFSVAETNGVLRVEFGGELLSEYRFRDVSRPFFYPLLGPDGVQMTRRWPQDEVAGEERDHPHHHALWWSHGDANGVDFWSEAANAGRTVHQYFTVRKGDAKQAVISSRNRWIAKDGRLIAEDERKTTFYPPTADARIVDFEITVFASGSELVLGDTKEGTFAIRLAESMRLKLADKSRGGTILNSRGDKDDATWGKRAEWCDYSGPIGGKTYGVTIFDHPSNPRYPTWWHVRDYGLFAANPFGVHDFEKRAKGTGDLTVPAGRSITFKYRILLHRGDASAAQVEAHQAAFVAGKSKS